MRRALAQYKPCHSVFHTLLELGATGLCLKCLILLALFSLLFSLVFLRSVCLPSFVSPGLYCQSALSTAICHAQSQQNNQVHFSLSTLQTVTLFLRPCRKCNQEPQAAALR